MPTITFYILTGYRLDIESIGKGYAKGHSSKESYLKDHNIGQHLSQNLAETSNQHL